MIRLLLTIVFILSLSVSLHVAPANANPEPQIAGAALYLQHCADCHRPLSSTLLQDRSAKRIRSAINVFPSMYYLKTLSDSDLKEIAAVLSSPQ